MNAVDRVADVLAGCHRNGKRHEQNDSGIAVQAKY